MKNGYLIAVCVLFFLSGGAYAQKPVNAKGNSSSQGVKNKKDYHVKWKTTPFDHQVFIANKGQFDGAIPGNDKILYAAQLGSVWVYFTAHGIVYQYKEW